MSRTDGFSIRYYRASALLHAFEVALREFPVALLPNGASSIAMASDPSGEPQWQDVVVESKSALEDLLRSALTTWGGAAYNDGEFKLLSFRTVGSEPFPFVLDIVMPDGPLLDRRLGNLPLVLPSIRKLVEDESQVASVAWEYTR